MKNINLKFLKFTFLGLSALLFSCEKLFFEEEQQSDNPRLIFDYLWSECDQKYAYFELKGIDWDQVYTSYSRLIYPEMTPDSLFRVLGSMLLELKDGHVNLFSDLNRSFFDIDGVGVDNFEWKTVTDHYLPENYYRSGPFSHDFLLNSNKEIGYIRFSSFPGTVDAKNLGFILKRYENTRGLILDLRENGGGAASDIFRILSRFVDDETLLFYSRLKNGPDHDDFTTPEPAITAPASDINYLKKVIILTDRGTYSAGSFTALASKAIPNLILMGDTTGGGLGLPNGGQLPNGWTYRFSITQALTLDMDPSFENGVPPDIVAAFDRSDFTIDEIIERAKVEILE